MEFKSREIVVKFRHPQKGFEEVEVGSEVRWDPLTGRAGRITAHRTLDIPVERGLPDISGIVEESRKGCVFCPPLLDVFTPKLPGGIFSTDKLDHKGTVLFPNLFPYGAASAVCIFGRDLHFIEIGKIGAELQVATFTNCVEYIRRYRGHNPALLYSSITQNYLPSSGGSFVHPHFQVQVDDFPAQHQFDMLDGARKYFQETDSNFWEDLIAEEKRRGERWIGRTGGWAWYTPFAPKGFKEAAAALPNRKCVTECSEAELLDLCRGIENVERYYSRAGCNSFNFALYSMSTPDPAWTLNFRILIRANWQPWYRNDRSFHEVMLGEAAVPEPPERIAEHLRPYFKGEK